MRSTATRGRVLDVVREQGQVSRVELAQATGLTQATISTVVRTLLDEGLLTESGAREFTGGKPRIKLTLNPRARCALGVQLAADWITVCIVDAAGAIIARTRVRGAGDEAPETSVTRIATTLERLMSLADISRNILVGLGLAVPGVVNLELGQIQRSLSLPQFDAYPIRDALASATGLDVSLENNGTAAAIGESWNRGARDSQAQCTVYMGASIGAGLILAGRVYRGSSGNVGAISPLQLSVPSWSEPHSLEALAGPRGVAARARLALQRGRHSAIVLPEYDRDPFLDFTAVASAAIAGDPLGMSLLEESADHLASAIVATANMLDLDSVVLAGPSFTLAGSLYLSVIQQRLDEAFYARGSHRVTVWLSGQIADAAAVGAAANMLQQELSPRAVGTPG
ncbi:MAG: ROK family protein [Arachnia sp.]